MVEEFPTQPGTCESLAKRMGSTVF